MPDINNNGNWLSKDEFAKLLKNSLEGLTKMITDHDDPSKTFKHDTYEPQFLSLYNENKYLLDEINEVYNSVDNKEELIKYVADTLADNVYSECSLTDKKSAREKLMLNYNLTLAVYVIPFIMEYKSDFSNELSDEIIASWNDRFPKANIGKSNFEAINSGFRNKLCYITTAVCQTLGKPDDCYELNLLRNYRDVYLMDEADGPEIIDEYYDIAPTIVKRINKSDNSSMVYKKVWEEYLNPCIKLIEADKKDECKDLYYQMVRDLEKQYCH